MRSAAVFAFVLVGAIVPAAAQQKPRPSAPSVEGSSARDLASAWSALASGRTTEAEAIADRLLQAGSRRHDAVAVKISARAQAGRPEAGLDQYEEWLKAAPHEDVFLLQPVAAGILEAQARAADIGVRVDALQALAEAGDKTAGARLAAVATSREVPGIADEALARIGNPEALARLTKRVATPSPRADVSGAIDALRKARPAGALAAISAALDPARPLPTKLAAARALGQLGAAEAIPPLKRALQDPDPPVRMVAAASLVRLGDQSGADLVREMENSPVADVRLMAVEGFAEGNPSGAWVSTATGMLQDPDPLARLRAAQLLVTHGADPAAARAVLESALADPNPALRLAAARTIEQVPREVLGTDIPSLRRLLRDADGHVRIVAAAALLRLAGGVE